MRQGRGITVAFHHLFLLSLPVSHIDQEEPAQEPKRSSGHECLVQ